MKVRLGVTGSQKVKFESETDTLTLKSSGLSSGTRLDGLDDVSTPITTNNSILTYETSSDTYVQRAPASVVQLIAENVLGLNYGGTGRSSFPVNSIIYAGNSTTMRAATGSVGQLLQIASNGTPTFSTLDGGSFA